MKNCIYRFLDENSNVIYIGKAKNLKSRLRGHNHLSKECYDEAKKVEYISFKNENDMDFAERYFIHKENPKYNTSLSDKPISINIVSLDMLSWLSYNNHYKNITENINIKIITDKEIEELTTLRIKENTLRDIVRSSNTSDDLRTAISFNLTEAIRDTKKMELNFTNKLISNGITKELAEIYVYHNIYDKEDIINKKLKEIEDECLNQCLIEINENGYYKHNTYLKIEEKFVANYTGIDYYWLSFLEGHWEISSTGSKRFILDNNIKNKLVLGIIKNIETKISQIYGKIKKDLIILKGNDHPLNGVYGFKFMERDIPYIIYRISK